MKIFECKQHSPEWFEIRQGRVTGSRFREATSKGRGSAISKTRQTYMCQLVAEKLSGEVAKGYSDSNMDWGTETEPEAREYYEKLNGCEVRQVGFVERDEFVGCSPDGLIGDDGMIEIKCPKSSTHLKYISENRLPPEYEDQVYGQLWVCERQWCDFVSYDPRVSMRPFFCKRVFRDESSISDLEIKLKIFTTEMKEMLEKITSAPF